MSNDFLAIMKLNLVQMRTPSLKILTIFGNLLLGMKYSIMKGKTIEITEQSSMNTMSH